MAQLKAAVSRLENGFLPGEHRQAQQVPAGTLAASARANAQHHADAEPLQFGRPARAPAARQPSSGRHNTEEEDGGGEDDGGDGGDDDDDDHEDAELVQFYRVSKEQREFNTRSAQAYRKGDVDRKVTRIVPPKILPSACQPELVGLGAMHMHAPHLELGLPLPPCPRCGWKSVDGGRVTSRGLCPARRIYAAEVDEWLGGFRLFCGICFDKKEELKAELNILDEEYDEEYAEAEAAVKAATYIYRSYNPESIRLYAERYDWWVESLEYVVLNKRTAITRSLSRRIMRACTKGSNPTDLAEELLELKSETFDSLQKQVHCTVL